MFYELCESTVTKMKNSSFLEFELELLRVIGIESPVEEGNFQTTDENQLTDLVYQSMREQYTRKCEKISHKAFPQIKHVHETMSDKYKNIVFPLTEGRREMQLIVNLEDAYKS